MVTCLYTPRPPLYLEILRGYDLLSSCVHASSHCIPVSSVTRSAPPVTVLSGWSGHTQAGEGTLVQCVHCTEGGIVDREEAM